MSRGPKPKYSQQPPGVVHNWSALQCSRKHTEQCGYDHGPVTRGRMQAQFPLPRGLPLQEVGHGQVPSVLSRGDIQACKGRVPHAQSGGSGYTEAVAAGSPYRYPLWLARALNSANYDVKWDCEGYTTIARIAAFYVKIAVFYNKFMLLCPIL